MKVAANLIYTKHAGPKCEHPLIQITNEGSSESLHGNGVFKGLPPNNDLIQLRFQCQMTVVLPNIIFMKQ